MKEKEGKIILAIVGMPGAGKSEATAYLEKKGYPFVRFGQLTDDMLRERGLVINPENERKYREEIRRELGMAAYAIKAKPKIDKLLSHNDLVVLDGLYSWEEYKYLISESLNLVLIHIFTPPSKRYQRLAKREIRPLTPTEARRRDIVEIENLNKGGPIAIADYIIVNTNDNIDVFYEKIDEVLKEIRQKP